MSPRFELRTMFLAIAFCAVLIAWFQSRSKEHALHRELPLLKRKACEVVVDDPSEYAVTKKDELFRYCHQWELYLPVSQSSAKTSYQLRLAVKKPTGNREIPSDLVFDISLDKPIHLIELNTNPGIAETTRIDLRVDGKLIGDISHVFEIRSFLLGGFDRREFPGQFPNDRPLVLCSEFDEELGIALWVERVERENK